MSLDQINLGAVPNDGSGDDLNAAGAKINAAIAALDLALQLGTPLSILTAVDDIFASPGSSIDIWGGVPSGTGLGQQGEGIGLRAAAGSNNTGGDGGTGGIDFIIGGDAGHVESGDGNGGLGGSVTIQSGRGGDNLAGVGDGGNAGNVIIRTSWGGLGNGGGVAGRNAMVIIERLNGDAGLPEFSDDAGAATGGLTVGALYHTSGVVKIRLS